MKNVFNVVLSSSGFNDINNFVSDESRNLFAQIALDKRVMILANAAPITNGNYIARENVAENFKKIGASQVDIIDLDNSNLDVINNYDVIYGLGGDPTYLIELVNNTNFKKYLLSFLCKGIYIGESVGSMILANDLKWAYEIKKGTKPKYDIILDTYKGLGLTDTIILPHFNKISEEIKDKARKFEQENGISFTRLNDGEYALELVDKL